MSTRVTIANMVYYVLVGVTSAALFLSSQLTRHLWTDYRTCCFSFESVQFELEVIYVLTIACQCHGTLRETMAL